MKNRLLVIFGMVLALVGLFSFAACSGTQTEKVTYTVTVSCEEDGVVENIKVQLKKGDEKVAEKGLTGGKAEFELEEGTYKATLIGVPEEYEFTEKTLTKDEPSAEMVVTKKQVSPALVTYTVTVSCEDALTGVKVRILKDGKQVAEKELTDGKAEFGLEEGTYAATLIGVPEEYEFTEKTLTKDAPSAEIVITKKQVSPALVTYTVTVTRTVSDVFGNTQKTAKAGVKVDLYEGETLVKSANTDAEGKASFEAEEKTYTAKVEGVAQALSFTERKAEAEVPESYVLGTEEHPLTWTLGENEVPLTEDVLNQYEEGVYYMFTPAETGNYTFTTDNYNKLIASEIFPNEVFSYDDDHVTVALMKGETYVFICNSTNYNGFGYTVTIAKGGSVGEDPEVPTPWQGSGTEKDPFQIVTLEGDYKVLLRYADGKYEAVYFTYTAKEAADYTVTSSDDEFFMQVGQENYVSGGEQLLRVEAGKTYLFKLTPYEGNDSSFVVEFKIEKGWSGWVSPWTGTGKYDDPYVIQTLADDYTVIVSIGGAFFRYTADKACDYTVTLTGEVIMDLSVREGAWDEKTNRQNIVLLESGAQGGFALEAGKTYFFYVSARTASAEPQDYTLKFKIAEGKYTPVETPGDGSEAHPFELDPIFGEHTINVESASGVWYSFELAKDTKVIVKAITPVYLTLNGAQFNASKADKEQEYALKAGTVKLNIMAYGGKAGEVRFSLTEVIEGDGSKESPFVLAELTGEYTATVEYKDGKFHYVYYTYEPKGEEELYTISTEDVNGNYSVILSGARPINSQVVQALKNDNRSINFKLEKGTTFGISVQELDEEETQTFTLKFKIAEYVAPPAALGSKENPEKLEELVGSRNVSAAPTYYYEYTAAETATYVISSNCAYGTEISVRLKSDMDTIIEKKTISSVEEQAILKLEGGKTYVLGFSPAETGEYGGGTFNFLIGIVRDDEAKEPDGTEAHPYPLKELLGKHELETTYTPGTWYVLNIEEEITVVVTADTKMIFTLGSEKAWQATSVGAAKEFTLAKGEVKLHVQFYGGTSGKVAFTFADKNLPAPETGSEGNPEALETFLGVHTGTAGYKLPYYYTLTLAERGYFTITNNSANQIKINNLTASAITLNASKSTGVSLEQGSYQFNVEVYGGDGLLPFEFKVEKFEAPEIPWKNGAGTQASPYVLETLTGQYSVAVSSPIYFTYTAKQDETYIFAPSTKIKLTLIKIGDTEKPVWKDAETFGDTDVPSATFMFAGGEGSVPRAVVLKAGDVLIFTAGNYSGNALTVISFEVTPGAGTETPPEPALFGEEYLGKWITLGVSANNVVTKYTLEITAEKLELSLGTTVASAVVAKAENGYTIQVSGTAQDGAYTLVYDAVYQILVLANSKAQKFYLGHENLNVAVDQAVYGTYTAEGQTDLVLDEAGITWKETVTLLSKKTEGEKYTYGFFTRKNAFSAAKLYVLTVEGGNATLIPEDGSAISFTKGETAEQKYTFAESMVGTWEAEGYVLTITADSFSLKNANGTEETYTLKQSGPNRYGDYEYTLIWNGKTYTVEQTDITEISFLQDGQPSLVFRKSTAGGSVKIDASYAGTYVCIEVDDEEAVGIPDLIIKADGTVEWGVHTVVVTDGQNGMYTVTIDGAAYRMQIMSNEFNTTLMLVNTSDGTMYTFGTQSSFGD